MGEAGETFALFFAAFAKSIHSKVNTYGVYSPTLFKKPVKKRLHILKNVLKRNFFFL